MNPVKMKIASGTSFLLMLFCFAKPYDCLADTSCSDRSSGFLQTCPKLDLNDYVKNTNIRNVIFEQQSVLERESRMVNVRAKVGSERLVNNRRIVDSDSRISNFPAKSDRVVNRDFRRSTFNARVTTRIPTLREFRVRDLNERDVNNRKMLARESELANFRSDDYKTQTTHRDRRITDRISRERAAIMDRESLIVNARERIESSSVRNGRVLTNRRTTRDATETPRVSNNPAANRESHVSKDGSSERNIFRRVRQISSTRNMQNRNIRSFRNADDVNINRIVLDRAAQLSSGDRSSTRRFIRNTRTINDDLRVSRDNRRIIDYNSQIRDERLAERRLNEHSRRHSNEQQSRGRNLRVVSSDRLMRDQNRQTENRRSLFDSRIRELRSSQNPVADRRFVEQDSRTHERFIDGSRSRVLERSFNSRERTSEEREVRKLETRSLKYSNDDRRSTDRESGIRERITSRSNARDVEENLNSRERTDGRFRKSEQLPSRRSVDERFADRDSRIRERLPTRTNSRTERTYEDQTVRRLEQRSADRRSQIRERIIGKSDFSNRQRTSSENRMREVQDYSRTSERRSTAERSTNIRTLRNSQISTNQHRATEDRRTTDLNLRNAGTGASTDRRVIRQIISDNYANVKDENNNERYRLTDRFNSNNHYEIIGKKTINIASWSNVITTALGVLLFAHIISTSSDLKKFQRFTTFINTAKEKVF